MPSPRNRGMSIRQRVYMCAQPPSLQPPMPQLDFQCCSIGQESSPNPSFSETDLHGHASMGNSLKERKPLRWSFRMHILNLNSKMDNDGLHLVHLDSVRAQDHLNARAFCWYTSFGNSVDSDASGGLRCWVALLRGFIAFPVSQSAP